MVGKVAAVGTVRRSAASFCGPARPGLATLPNLPAMVVSTPRDQYLMTAMIAATMNAATSESARSSVFDRGVAGESGGFMTLRRRLQFANEPANIAGLHGI
ncbi:MULTISPECIES: hypothetical protein [unclassified Bradyrhizobium]|uniref:hypothetical protein n=1 Tax=unclassified Bradyrhizobium TaxID=2631580 RepID=UPI001BAB39A3|nr:MULTISPECIES: hypothetical protein [unclassified Bradyrhizobium]MBR1226988.1 hypothetical protein [Bradyrhizobium sp. AUGA SZCCT0176]MBR1296668.1 hypothetical protein [Bradyrhizobium sp. AUGA SZCCT0042]